MANPPMALSLKETIKYQKEIALNILLIRGPPNNLTDTVKCVFSVDMEL